MKTILPWGLALLALCAAGVLYQRNSARSVELAKLQADVQELQSLREENSGLKSRLVPAEELAQLRQDKLDLLRLRNEIRQSRDEKVKLTQQAQSALTQAQRAQAQAQAAQLQVAEASAAAQQALATRAGLTSSPAQQTAACIGLLRQLDGAKQQWALENKKPEDATPTPQDLTPFFKDSVVPACPGGGNYTLGAVNVAPTCSVAGHVLPQ